MRSSRAGGRATRFAGLFAAVITGVSLAACGPPGGIGVVNETDGKVVIQSYSRTEGWRDIQTLAANRSATIYPGLPSKDGELQCKPDADYRAVNEAGTVLLDITTVCPGDDVTISPDR